jgi:ATP-dependent helicase/nuclease subunit B
MASIARTVLEVGAAEPWTDAVALAVRWADAQGVELRDALFLVPFAQHLPLARRAWAASGRWMPRVETTQTLAAALGPPETPDADQVTFETALDRLTARRLLRGQAWAEDWAGRDPRGFEHAIGGLVRLAQALARAAAACTADERAARWQEARSRLASGGGIERLLGRIGVEWAAAAPAPATDRLFACAPSGWIALRAAGEDPLMDRLLAAARAPCLRIDADVDPAMPGPAEVSLGNCQGFEDEARRTAAQVLECIGARATPVALIAADRLLVRRVRALLARRGVPIQDETGWKLSTTRAGAQVATLLKAARGDATCDDRLDWLKGLGRWPGDAVSDLALESLEGVLRRRGWTQPAAVDRGALAPGAARLWEAAEAALAPLRTARAQALGAWLDATARALEACGARAALGDDDAGRQVLEALHLEAQPPATDDRLDLDDYAAWVDAVLEEALFRPQAPVDAPVVITPLERAMLRPFRAVVLAGADEKRLGARPAPWPFLEETLAERLGLPTRAARAQREALAFAQLLRVPRVVVLRRADDGGEPLAPSPLLERLELARLAHGRGPLAAAHDATVARAVEAHPTPRPAPRAGDRLPTRLSASACEALRACPYRFHVQHVLGLREVEELDDEVEKRDYGTWLHDVLLRFHATRGAPQEASVEGARLQAVARDVNAERHVEDAAFLPYAASFAAFVPRYVAWLHGRDRAGARWVGGEQALEAQPEGWKGLAMYGRVDRIDAAGDARHPVTQLIDYKTTSPKTLRERLKEPLEDTQLAFYAALVRASGGGAAGVIEAAYLPVDARDELDLVPHDDVEASARALVAHLGEELARVRAGAPLPALGEGEACTWCAARGLCRRDHWTTDAEAA